MPRRSLLFVALMLALPLAPAAEDSTQAWLDDLRTRGTAEGWTFTVGDNPALHEDLSDLCGLVPPPDWRPARPSRRVEMLTDLPAAFDWRTLGGVTAVKNQANCGSCWAFATIGAFEAAVKIQTGSEFDFSEQALLSCNESGYSCDGGWFVPEMCADPGSTYESCMPYEADDTVPCDTTCPHDYQLVSWGYVNEYQDIPTVEEIKSAIYRYGPVAAGVLATQAFSAYTGGVFNAGETGDLNHGIVLVGWDDSKGAWILKNSWSSRWGVGGYMDIAYGTNLVGYGAMFLSFEPPPPVLISVRKLANPLRLKLYGGNFHPSSAVKIAWEGGQEFFPLVKFKDAFTLVAKGSVLKAALPKKTTVRVSVVNPDGQESASVTFTR